MKSRRRTPSSRSGRTSLTKKLSTIGAEETSIKSETAEIIPKEDVCTDLLYSLLGSITNESEINKSFARLTFSNSNSYCGWISQNGFQGFGSYTFANGASVKGLFEESLTRGLGRYNYKMGAIYEGEFLAGRRHGFGKYNTRRFRYEGYFKNGKFHGQGIWKSNTVEAEGIFDAGFLKHGEIRDPNGTFKGAFDESGLRKQGKFTFRNGNTYNGCWSNDLFEGFGIYDWCNEETIPTKTETKYVGYWIKGKRDGIGMITFQKRCISCQWSNDLKSGAGVIIACNGNVYASTELFHADQYRDSSRIRMCSESRQILLQMGKLIISEEIHDNVTNKSNAFMEKVKELLDNHSDGLQNFNPICIPFYEIGELSPGPHNTSLEKKYLQQVVTENYDYFHHLYLKYTFSKQEYMSHLGLNLFLMDMFAKVEDVSLASFLRPKSQNVFYEDTEIVYPLEPVSFYEFLEAFLEATEVLMENTELSLASEQVRPTFFGHLATQVLFLLKILSTQEEPMFLVRQGLDVNRPAMLNILEIMEEQSFEDKSVRTAYKFLQSRNVLGGCNGGNLHFIQAVEMHFPNILEYGALCGVDFQLSNLELLELVLRTSELKLTADEARKAKELKINKLKT